MRSLLFCFSQVVASICKCYDIGVLISGSDEHVKQNKSAGYR